VEENFSMFPSTNTRMLDKANLALLPLEAVLVNDLVGDGVGRNQSSSTTSSSQSQTGVDVQVGLSATRREFGLSVGDGIGDEVILGEWASEDGLSRPLSRLSAEEVNGLLNSSNTSIQGGVATVISFVDGVGPSLAQLVKPNEE
jgi:hypothetical protein